MRSFGIIRCDKSWPALSIDPGMGSYGDRMSELMDAWAWYRIYMSDDDDLDSYGDDDVDVNAIFFKEIVEPDELALIAKRIQRAFMRGMKPRRPAKIISKSVALVPPPAQKIIAASSLMDAFIARQQLDLH